MARGLEQPLRGNGLLQHGCGELAHERAALDVAEEGRGREEPPLRMPPSDQRFDPNGPPRGQRGLRLEEEEKLVLLHGSSEFEQRPHMLRTDDGRHLRQGVRDELPSEGSPGEALFGHSCFVPIVTSSQPNPGVRHRDFGTVPAAPCRLSPAGMASSDVHLRSLKHYRGAVESLEVRSSSRGTGRWSDAVRALPAVAAREGSSRSNRRRLSLLTSASERTVLLGMIGHDLRGPLATISGLANALASRDVDSRELREDLELLAAEAARALQLTTDIVRLAEVEGRPLRREELDVREVICGVVARVEAERPAGDLDIDVDPECFVFADRVAIEQVLQNLFANALRHADAREPRVRLGCRCDVDVVELYVEDNGAGFPPGRERELLEPFRSGLGSSSVSPRSNAGLGLAIASTLAARSGGEIRIGRSLLGGAEVVIRLAQRPRS